VPADEVSAETQMRIHHVTCEGVPEIGDGARRILSELPFPRYYLDFETVMPAIPVWNECRPYDAVPVQFSCHVKDEDGTITHQEWLAKGPPDPREDLATELIDACRGVRTIVAYHASTERRCLEVLQQAVPHLAGPLQDLIDRLEDLLPIVRNHVYHPDFRGSFSIKDVLPVLVPDLAFQVLVTEHFSDPRDEIDIKIVRGPKSHNGIILQVPQRQGIDFVICRKHFPQGFFQTFKIFGFRFDKNVDIRRQT